jgi:glycine cleavage system H protein
MSRPAELKYTPTHEWVRVEGDTATVGLTDFAVEPLSDLAFIDLPKVGATAKKGTRFGEIESTKAVSDLVAPVSGEIVEVNADVLANLPIVSASPFAEGWMIRVRLSDPAELQGLLDAGAYALEVEKARDH